MIVNPKAGVGEKWQAEQAEGEKAGVSPEGSLRFVAGKEAESGNVGKEAQAEDRESHELSSCIEVRRDR